MFLVEKTYVNATDGAYVVLINHDHIGFSYDFEDAYEMAVRGGDVWPELFRNYGMPTEVQGIIQEIKLDRMGDAIRRSIQALQQHYDKLMVDLGKVRHEARREGQAAGYAEALEEYGIEVGPLL